MQRFTARMPLLTAKTSQPSAVKLRLTFLFIVAAVKAHSSQSAYNDTDQQITHKTGDRKFTKLKKALNQNGIQTLNQKTWPIDKIQ